MQVGHGQIFDVRKTRGTFTEVGGGATKKLDIAMLYIMHYWCSLILEKA